MRKKLITLVLALVSMTSFAQHQYAHPGIDLTQEELDRIKTNVNAYKQPWQDGWNKLLAERDARSDFKASPKSTVGGSDGTRQRAERDADAAYYNILRWYVTGSVDNAECAVSILNDWSNSIQKEVTGELFMLPIWSFMKAAELVRLYPGWKQADKERFTTMARDYFYPACKKFVDQSTTSWPGWGGPANFCCLAIGIYLDDADKVDEAIRVYKEGTNNGGACVHNGILPSGQCVEMGRDQPHAEIGINAYSDFCKAAWNQGIDLYSYDDNLLLKAYEYLCHFNLDHADEVKWETVSYGGHNFYYPANSNNSPGSMPQNRIYGGLHYQSAYHHYTEVKKLAAPWMRAMIHLAPSEALRGTLWTISDTTTVYNKPVKPSTPIHLTAEPGLKRIHLNWEAAVPNLTSGCVIQRKEGSGSWTNLITFTRNCSSEYVDTDVEVGKTYSYRLRSTNYGGTQSSGWSVTVSATPVAAEESLPAGWTKTDLGDVALEGTSEWANVQGGSWRILGSGIDNWSGKQAIGNFTHTSVSGDFDIKMRIAECEQSGSEIKVKVGLAAFEQLTTYSQSVFMQLEGTGTRFANFAWRTPGATKLEVLHGCDHTWSPVWFRMKREGNVFTGYQSVDGENWINIGSCTLNFSKNAYVGLFVTSGGYRQNGFTALFDHVSLGTTATGISKIEASRDSLDEDSIYDLSGRKMNEYNLVSGIYIKNHKKFLVK